MSATHPYKPGDNPGTTNRDVPPVPAAPWDSHGIRWAGRGYLVGCFSLGGTMLSPVASLRTTVKERAVQRWNRKRRRG